MGWGGGAAPHLSPHPSGMTAAGHMQHLGASNTYPQRHHPAATRTRINSNSIHDPVCSRSRDMTPCHRRRSAARGGEGRAPWEGTSNPYPGRSLKDPTQYHGPATTQVLHWANIPIGLLGPFSIARHYFTRPTPTFIRNEPPPTGRRIECNSGRQGHLPEREPSRWAIHR